MSFTEKLDMVNASYTEVKDGLDTIARVIALPMEQWDSTTNIMANMKRTLCVLTLWLRMRKSWIQLTDAIGELNNNVKHNISNHSSWTSLSVGTYGSGWHQGKHSSHTLRANEMVESFPDAEEFVETSKIVRKIETIGKLADQLFKQSMELVKEVPEYKTLKKLLPIGGRLFYSVLNACQRGTLSTTMPDQNCLFGYEDDTEQFARLLTHTQRSLKDKREKGGKAPSWARARDEYVPTRLESRLSESSNRTLESRLDNYAFQFCGNKELESVCSGTWLNSPTLVMIARSKGERKAKRMLQAIQGKNNTMRNDVHTVYTSKPVRLSGNDYVVRGSWLEVTDKYRMVWRDNRKRTIVNGFIYFRANWPDCFHSPTELTSREASTQLDQSSEYYFRRLASIEEQRLSARQRVARLLKRLRKVSCVCVDDSRSVGNCLPGTYTFMNQLEIDRDVRCVDGRTLAVKWRAKSYPQLGRFASVVEKAELRIKQLVKSFNPFEGVS